MPTSRFERFLPISGVLAGVFYAAMALLIKGMPSISDSQAGYAQWIDDHQLRTGLSGAAAGYFCVAMLFFATSIRRALRSGEPNESTYSSAAFAGALTIAGAVATMGWVTMSALEAANDHSQAAVSALGYLADFGWLPWVAGSAVFFLAAGIGGLRTAVLPKWLSIVSVVLGVLSLLGPTGIAVYFATPFWLVVTGVVLAARARRAEEAVATRRPAESVQV
jgi:hypothetical protein